MAKSTAKKKRRVAPKVSKEKPSTDEKKGGDSNVVPMPKVESGIPIPSIQTSGKWDFIKDMKPGDSFFLNADNYNISSTTGTIRSVASRNGFKVTVRNLEENGKAGARVWRK